MFGSYTAQEAVLAALVGLLAGNEIRGIIAARMAGWYISGRIAPGRALL